VTYVVLTFTVTVLVCLYAMWTASRIDRVQDRCGAARANLDAQLVRRAAAAAALGRDHADRLGDGGEELRRTAAVALASDDESRGMAENDLTRTLRQLPLLQGDPLLAEVAAATRRMVLARHIYNDAVRDTLTLRRRRWPRALRLGASHPLPAYFDVEESTPGQPAGESLPGSG
jgi:hypothetical protein